MKKVKITVREIESLLTKYTIEFNEALRNNDFTTASYYNGKIELLKELEARA